MRMLSTVKPGREREREIVDKYVKDEKDSFGYRRQERECVRERERERVGL